MATKRPTKATKTAPAKKTPTKKPTPCVKKVLCAKSKTRTVISDKVHPTTGKRGEYVFDEKGNFAPGCKPTGRWPREHNQKYAQAFEEAVTKEDWIVIIKMAVRDAKCGDAPARRWLGDYLVGKPTQRHEINTTDGAPLIVLPSSLFGMIGNDHKMPLPGQGDTGVPRF